MDNKTKKMTLLACLLNFIGVFEFFAVPVVLPQLSIVLNMEFYLVNWVTIIYLLFSSAFGLILGKIIPKYGFMKVGKVCVIITIICAVISTSFLNIYSILFVRAIQGICAAGFFFISYYISFQCVEKKDVDLAISFVGASSFLSVVLGPFIGGFLTYLSPQYIFSVNIPLMVICLFLFFTVKEEWQYDVKIDYVGGLISVVAIILLTLGITFLKEDIGLIFFIISIFIMALFVFYELKVDNPLYNFRLFKNKVYVLDNYSSMMGCFIYQGFIFVFTLYFQYIGIFSPAQTGIFMALIGVIVFFITPLSGKLSMMYDSRKLAIFGSLLMTISLLLILFKNLISFWFFLSLVIILFIGFGLFDTPNKNLVYENSNKNYSSDVIAFLSFVRDIGTLLSMAVYTFSLSLFSIIKFKTGIFEFSFLFMVGLFFLISLSILFINLKFVKKIK